MAKHRKKKKKGGALLIAAIIVCLIAAAFSGYKLFTALFEYKQARDEYSALKEYTVLKTERGKTAESSSSEGENEEDEVMVPMEIDFDALLKINPDIVAWLYVPAEEISYPVVQGPDNDYYLHKTVEGTYNYSGSIFLESLNSPDFSDPNTIIYGHNMKDKSMFGKLKFLTEYEDYKTDDTFWVFTPECSYSYKMFSIHQTQTESSAYTLFPNPSSEVSSFIESMYLKSEADLAIGDYNGNSKVVTLSTCSSSSGTSRYVVHGILTGTYIG